MKYIFHIDINAFFASVEEIKNSKLSKIPFAVAVRTTNSGLISCPNYVARKFGIKSAMNIGYAKILCADLQIIKIDHDAYDYYSNLFFNFLEKRFFNKIEIFSIDECYIDVTNQVKNIKQAQLLAKDLQELILNQLNLKTNIGISDNKFVAKMVSDLHKPLGIVSCFGLEQFKKIIWPLPIESFLFIGSKKIPLLKELGINTIGDLAQSNKINELKKIFINQFQSFMDCAWGKGDDLIDNKEKNNKIISASRTLFEPTVDYDYLKKYIWKLTVQLWNRFKEYEMQKIYNFVLTVQYVDSEKKNFTYKNTKNELNSFEKIYLNVVNLLDKIYDYTPIIFLGLSIRILKIKTKQVNILNLNEIKKNNEINKIKKIVKNCLKH